MNKFFNKIRVKISNAGNPICKKFGHKWGELNKVQYEGEAEFYEQSCKRCNCAAFRQGSFSKMIEVDPNEMWKF